MRRRDCVGAGAGLPIMFKSPSLLSKEGNGNEHIVAAVADNTEGEDAVVAATVSKGYQDDLGRDYALFESPGQGGFHDSSLGFDLAASGLEGAEFSKANPGTRHKGY